MSRFLSRTTLRHLRIAGPLAAAAALGFGTLPALAQSTPLPSATDCSAIHFELANPGPGSRVEQGTSVIQGIAKDVRATDGVGIDQIEFFLDNRDEGGVKIGTVTPGTIPGPFGPGSFTTTVSFPETNGGHDLFAYAHSSVTGQEGIIAMPIAVGENPSDAGESATAVTTETCTNGGNVASTTTPMTPPTTSETPTTPASPAAAAPATVDGPTLTLEVANPSPGDTVHVGGINIQGSAWDTAAKEGAGVDRIDVFLDDRDNGGILLTQATLGAMNGWQAHVSLPSNQTGLHTLNFYAHSTVTDHETLVSVPITIEP